MIPIPKRRSLCTHSAASKSPFIVSALTQTLAVIVLLLVISGCSTPKQTWRDWMKAQTVATWNHEARVLPPTPAPSVDTNTLVLAPGYKIGDGAHVYPGFDLKMRNPDFPRTHIEAVYIDLSSPTNGLWIKWTGPEASAGPIGPWRFTPGRGGEGVDCNDVETSDQFGSLCTPKGAFPVAGFADHLYQTPICRYVTWVIHAPRFVAIHSHTELPATPASAGCIRVPYEVAKLIHNNSLVGITIVSISGTWHHAPKKD